ncbi:MAG: hypothetical protein ACE5IC_03460, partial [Candidatus Brocadiales bacterium]
MVWWLLKRWRETPEDYEQEMYGRGGETFEKAKLAEEHIETEEEEPYRDVLVEEEEPERAAPLEEVEKEEYEEAYEEEEEVETPGGVFISDRKIRGGFKKFGISLLSLFLLPWILAFGIALVACASLIIFPAILSLFPIFLVALFVLAIVAPVIMPLLIIYFLVTERGKLLINSEGKRFSISFSVPIQEEKEKLERPEEAPTEEYL